MSWCETEMQKYMPLVKQDVMKFEVFILGGQRIDQKRSKGWSDTNPITLPCSLARAGNKQSSVLTTMILQTAIFAERIG